MSQPEKTGILYEQIIARVIEDSRERLEAEGADLQVLGELQKLWWEKLQGAGIVGASRGAGGVGGAGGYHMQATKIEDHGMHFQPGYPPARMTPSHAGSNAFPKVNVKNELPQTDGADVGDDSSEAGVAASRPGRRPRRGDYVELEVSMGGEGPSEAKFLNVEQLDGAGAGPRKRGRDEDEDEPDGVLDDDDDDPLNSDDDDEEDAEDMSTTDNLVLCQYDKVARTKNKWKAQLKFGVMTLGLADGRKQDFIFNKAAADMNFAN